MSAECICNVAEYGHSEACIRAQLIAAKAEAQEAMDSANWLTLERERLTLEIQDARAEAQQLREERDDYKGRNEAEYYRNEELSALLSETARTGYDEAQRLTKRAEKAEAENARLRSELEVEIAQREGDCARMQFDRDETLKAIDVLQARLAQAMAALEAAISLVDDCMDLLVNQGVRRNVQMDDIIERYDALALLRGTEEK